MNAANNKLIFGHLLTSSNYNNFEKKVVGRYNGYGTKLCNIFSTKFIVEMFAKLWKGEVKFQMNHLDDIRVIMFLNDRNLKLNNFKDYIQMYLKRALKPDGEDLNQEACGGTHVNYMLDDILKLIQEALDKKKLKSKILLGVI
ncbi:DNA topoisomerase 2 [Massospora cicadina]|nr:DNA topoisomerase 2 [Massospora cicadina]